MSCRAGSSAASTRGVIASMRKITHVCWVGLRLRRYNSPVFDNMAAQKPGKTSRIIMATARAATAATPFVRRLSTGTVESSPIFSKKFERIRIIDCQSRAIKSSVCAFWIYSKQAHLMLY